MVQRFRSPSRRAGDLPKSVAWRRSNVANGNNIAATSALFATPNPNLAKVNTATHVVAATVTATCGTEFSVKLNIVSCFIVGGSRRSSEVSRLDAGQSSRSWNVVLPRRHTRIANDRTSLGWRSKAVALRTRRPVHEPIDQLRRNARLGHEQLATSIHTPGGF